MDGTIPAARGAGSTPKPDRATSPKLDRTMQACE
jgi:hypothetical protein